MTSVRIVSWLHWLLICLCLIPITGCMFDATPLAYNLDGSYNLDIHDDVRLPNLPLVRRVVPEVGKGQKVAFQGTVDVVSESQFSKPDE